MTPVEYKKLKQIQRLLWFSIGFLMMAELGYMLQSLMSYVVGVIGAAAIFALHWYSRKQLKPGKIRSAIAIGLPLLTVFAPVIFLLSRLYVFDGALLWLNFFLLMGFVVPLVVMLYAYHAIQKILDHAPLPI